MIKNAYIHIPFCKSKCYYCVFTSFASLKSKEPYIKALIQQIKAQYNGEKFNTLYFGGGTPSLLKINELGEIISLFEFETDAEITIEANPDGISKEYLQELNNIGFNRISFGTQSFNDKLLKQIGRTQSSKDTKNAVINAKNAGFKNISLDLIYGLLAQNIEDFSKDLDEIISLEVQHVSLYGLKIEKGCVFYTKTPDKLPNADMQADMIILAEEKLKRAGFEHYEISNFAKAEFQSRHNLNYWDNNSYYGFGLAASGYEEDVRYQNETNLKKYIQNPTKRTIEEKVSLQQQLEEEIFLGLRKSQGINFEKINKKFNIDFEKEYERILNKYSKYLQKNKNFYFLTEKGFLISNEIMSEFIEI